MINKYQKSIFVFGIATRNNVKLNPKLWFMFTFTCRKVILYLNSKLLSIIECVKIICQVQSCSSVAICFVMLHCQHLAIYWTSYSHAIENVAKFIALLLASYSLKACSQKDRFVISICDYSVQNNAKEIVHKTFPS